jgi:hypothetical protein
MTYFRCFFEMKVAEIQVLWLDTAKAMRITKYFLSPFLLTTFLLASSALAPAQRGARTVSRGLDRLVQESDLIVRGSIKSARVEPHPQFKNLSTVVVTMQVDETLKGTAKKTLEFRQYIWDIRDQVDAARYAKGSAVLLLLGPVSQYGLRSPVGLDQGRFTITRDATGKETAVNGTGNIGLMVVAPQNAKAASTASKRTAELLQQKPSGALQLSDLEQAIRAFVAVTK